MHIRILFVCLGNICRSPMAEAVMRKLVQDNGLSEQVEVDSAGTGDWHLGKPPHEGTRRILSDRNISYEGMSARQVVPVDFEQFTYIVCMDSSNISNVRALLKEAKERETGRFHPYAGSKEQLFTFMELLPKQGIQDVPDPYYTGNFDYVYELVEAGCQALLIKIKADMEQA